jgi:hypothetical protein
LAQTPPVIQPEQLLQALSRCDDQLDLWINKSPDNAALFMQDPMAAMQAAEAELDQDVILELESVLSGLARKLDLPVSTLPMVGFRKAS